MTLRERLDADLKDAMRGHDTVSLNVIRGIKAGILAQETRNVRSVLDESGIVSVIVKEVKERRDALPDFQRAGRQDLVEKLSAEIEILQHYLPQPLTETEITDLITEALDAVQATGPKDMGQVMGWITPRVKGRADGKWVSDRVKERLQAL